MPILEQDSSRLFPIFQSPTIEKNKTNGDKVKGLQKDVKNVIGRRRYESRSRRRRRKKSVVSEMQNRIISGDMTESVAIKV